MRIAVTYEKEMLIQDIRSHLFQMQDTKYRSFQCKLIPTVPQESVIGVRTPALRQYAKELLKEEDIELFLKDLPHQYFDENQLHAFIISEYKDFDRCMEEVTSFLPYIDNWATCDQLSPKVFKKHRSELPDYAALWISSDEIYKIRFGIGILMKHFLDEDFNLSYPEMVAGIRSEEYYVNMMIAWYFATALAKQYEEILPFIENRRLDTWTHNKAIQKAIESDRILADQKEYLRRLKIKKK